MKRNIIVFSVLIAVLAVCSLCVFAADINTVYYDYGIAAERAEHIKNDNPFFYTSGETVNLKEPVCEGFEFVGWYLESDYRTLVTSLDNVSDDITLYAKWYELTYGINYVLTSDGIKLTQNEITNTNPMSRYSSERVYLAAPDCAVSYYTFDGWYFDAEFTEKAEYIESYTCGDVTLYAHWVNSEFSLQYIPGDISTSLYTFKNPNPASYKYGEPLRLMPLISDDPAFTFDGWYSDEFFTMPVTDISAGTYGDITLYAKWIRAVYNINYVLTDNNITEPSEITNSNPTSRAAGESVMLSSPESVNKKYKFAGWYTSPERDDNSRITEISASVQGEITVYAKWETAVYKITYNYGVVNPVYVDFENNNPTEYLYGDSFELRPIEIEGFIFNGWRTDENLKNGISGISEDTWGDIKLYADFTEKTYTIEYIVEDKEVIASQVVNTNPTVRTTTQRVGFDEAQTLNTSYSFGGWYYDKEFTQEASVIRPYTAQNITVYAKWIKIVSYLPVWGDVTLSEMLSAADARLALRYSAGLVSFNDTQKRLGDINNDSSVNAADARLILRLSAGIESEKELVEKYSLPIIELVDGEVAFKETLNKSRSER